jgi:hypothetical protein
LVILNTFREVAVTIPFSIVGGACVVALCSGCGETILAPPASRPPGQSPTAPPTTPATHGAGFPALEHPGGIYAEEGDVYAFFYPNQGSLISRYVLYDDGSFELQFVSETFGFFAYKGTYIAAANQSALYFADSNSAGPWTATAQLSGDEMSVKYNDVMMMADFIDGVYKRVPPG